VHLIDRRTAETRTVLRCPLQNVRRLAFAPDGRTLATACEREPFVRLWDVTESPSRQRAVTAPQTAEIAALAFSPDGRRLATVDQKKIRFWDPVTGRAQGTLESEQSIQDLMFTPDGHTLLTAGLSLQVWDVGDNIALAKRASTVRPPSAVTRLAVTRDGRRVVAGAVNGMVRLWRLSEDRKLTPEETNFSWTHRGEAVTDLSFGADDKTLFVGVSGKVFLCVLPGGQYNNTLSGAVRKGALSPDGRMLAVVGEDGVVRLWDVKAWRMRSPANQALSRVNSLTFSADGRTLITASRVTGFSIRSRKFLVEDTASLRSTAESIRFWDLATEQEGPSVLPARETMTPPYVVARSADDRLLAAGAEDGSIQIWDQSQREKQTRLFVSDPARLFAHLAELFRALRTTSNPEYAKDTEGVAALAFSPDGRWLAAAGKRGSLRIWETCTWKERWYQRSDAGASPWLVFTPDSSAVVGGRGGQVCVWDTRTGQTRTTLGAKTDAPVLCGVFVPGQDVLAIGTKDGTIGLWYPRSCEVKRLPAGHQDRVTSLAFTPDGKTLASASWDRTVRLWSMRAGREVAALEGHKGRVNAVAFSPDGKVLASGGEIGELLGEVLLWRR
jgi:WD40 repeat protein